MRASPSPQKAFQLFRSLSPSPFGRGLGRGRKCRTYFWRDLWWRSLSAVLTQDTKCSSVLAQNYSGGQVSPLNKEFFRAFRLTLVMLLCCATVALQPGAVLGQRQNQSRTATVTVNFTPGHPANRFIPSHSLGAAVDGHDKGVIDLQLTPPNIQAMLSAGLKSLSYRLRTELANDAWHWNPRGSWSDANNRQGYWTSDEKTAAPIELSYGYRLPRRGNTIDQANDDGYSRLDDGDPQTFWKSNPYLDRAFTAESNSVHPQWIVIEFEKAVPINAMRLAWAEPFATRYQIQYGNFDDVSDIALSPPG
ncbi:MAG: hypothetical protein QOE96_2792, partial [Blastocatellia bacterium]|nr:hypothetical protein [Blastocatellia bacterium]